MEQIIIALNVVLPVFVIIVVGYLLRFKRVINESFIDMAMKVVFNISLPAMLFSKVSKADINLIFEKSSLKFVLFVTLGTLFIFVMARVVARLFVKNPQSRGAFTQGSFRSNYVIIGYSILYSLFGDVIIGRMALLVIVIVPLYNILSIWVLSESSEKSPLENLKDVAKKVIKNPLIIGIIIGFIVAIFKFEIPLFINDSISSLGAIGTPLGLIGLGAYFTIDQVKSLKMSILAVLLKIVVFPTIMTTLAYGLGFGYMDAAIVFVTFGAPAAISSFIMATALDGDKQLAANIVILSTVLSIFTLVVGLSLIGGLYI